MRTLQVIIGETKNLLFRIKDSTGTPMDLSDMQFGFKLGTGDRILVQRSDADFDKSDAANGEISVVCPFEECGTFYALLEINQGGALIHKSKHRVKVNEEL